MVETICRERWRAISHIIALTGSTGDLASFRVHRARDSTWPAIARSHVISGSGLCAIRQLLHREQKLSPADRIQ